MNRTGLHGQQGPGLSHSTTHLHWPSTRTLKVENPWDSMLTLEAPQLSARIARPQDYQQHPAQDTDTEN